MRRALYHAYDLECVLSVVIVRRIRKRIWEMMKGTKGFGRLSPIVLITMSAELIGWVVAEGGEMRN
jgi:hypothetical protein